MTRHPQVEIRSVMFNAVIVWSGTVDEEIKVRLSLRTPCRRRHQAAEIGEPDCAGNDRTVQQSKKVSRIA